MKNFKYILRISLTLLIIAASMAAALAAVNQFTAPRIAKFQAEKTQEAVNLVLPGGGEEIPFTDATGLVSTVYASETGYAVEVQPMGFDNTITMMVGIDKAGQILGIQVISHTETAGLGAVAAAKTSAGEAFRGQFVGMGGNLAVTKDGGAVDSITGATITSRAICNGVNAALACVKALG